MIYFPRLTFQMLMTFHRKFWDSPEANGPPFDDPDEEMGNLFLALLEEDKQRTAK